MKNAFLVTGLLLALSAPAASQWSDNFDGYADKTLLDNVGGWFGWDNTPAAAGSVSSVVARSAPHSILVGASADAVHPGLGATSGRWVLSAWQYIPTGSLTARTYFIINNRYSHGGPYAWSGQFRFEPTTKTVIDDLGGSARTKAPLPIVFDAWVEIRVEIDLDLNTMAAYYNDDLLSQGTYVTSTTAPKAIENIDLYSEGATCYYDDISLTGSTWSDNFDGYADKTLLDNVGGWFGWDNTPAAAGTVSSVQARSAPHSIEVGAAADAVHPGLGATSGRWVLRAWQYIPTGSLTARTYFIINNRYSHGGPYAWSGQFRFEPTTKTVIDDLGGSARVKTALPIVFDQWVEIRVEIDLDLNTMAAYYGGQRISAGSSAPSTTAPKAIENIDLYSEGATCYYDDISLTPATDDFGIRIAQAATTTSLTFWIDEADAPSGAAAVIYAPKNIAPWKFPIISGSIWLDPTSLTALPALTLDANGRASLTGSYPTIGTVLTGWFQAFSLPTGGLPLLASDAAVAGDGDDGTSSASIVYNAADGRYTVTWQGPSTGDIKHLPSNTVLGTVASGGFTGQKFLAAGESLIVEEAVAKKELTRVTQN